MRSVRTDQGRDAPVREQIKGHTVGSDGIVYNPETASFGYISQLDSRVENNHSNETGMLVTDQGRYVPVTAPATGGGVGQGAVATFGGGGTTGAGVERVVAPGRTSPPKGSGSTLAGVFDGPNKLKSELKPENTSVLFFGHELFVPPGFSNADQWEEMLGEDFGGIVGGILNVGPFIGYNAKLAYNRNYAEQNEAWAQAVADETPVRGGNAFPALVETFDAWANDMLAPRRDGLNGEQYRTGGGF